MVGWDDVNQNETVNLLRLAKSTKQCFCFLNIICIWNIYAHPKRSETRATSFQMNKNGPTDQRKGETEKIEPTEKL